LSNCVIEKEKGVSSMSDESDILKQKKRIFTLKVNNIFIIIPTHTKIF